MSTRREDTLQLAQEMNDDARTFGHAIIAATDEILRLHQVQFWSQVAFVALIQWAEDSGFCTFNPATRAFLVKSIRGLRPG